MLRKLLYIPLTLLLKLLAGLPMPFVRAFGRLLFRLLYSWTGYRRKVVRENLRNSFPEATSNWIDGVEKKYYHHLGRIMAETFKTPGLSAAYFKKTIRVEGLELLEAAQQKNVPVVLMCGHTGNWEWASLRTAVDFSPINVVYKPVSNQQFDKWYYKLRSRFGVKPFPMAQAGRLIGEKGHFGLHCFVADQTPSDVNSGYWLPFLHRETLFFDGFIRIAQKMKAQLVFGSMVAEGNGYVITLRKIAEDASEMEPEFLLRTYVQMLEQHIYQHPWNWLWSHRRWKRTRSKNM